MDKIINPNTGIPMYQTPDPIQYDVTGNDYLQNEVPSKLEPMDVLPVPVMIVQRAQSLQPSQIIRLGIASYHIDPASGTKLPLVVIGRMMNRSRLVISNIGLNTIYIGTDANMNVLVNSFPILSNTLFMTNTNEAIWVSALAATDICLAWDYTTEYLNDKQ